LVGVLRPIPYPLDNNIGVATLITKAKRREHTPQHQQQQPTAYNDNIQQQTTTYITIDKHILTGINTIINKQKSFYLPAPLVGQFDSHPHLMVSSSASSSSSSSSSSS